MAERMRATGDNSITDKDRVAALAALATTRTELEEANEVLKAARSKHSNELKAWKKKGHNIKALKLALDDRFVDPAENVRDLNDYLRYRALQNFPSIQQDLAALWEGVDLPDEDKEEIDRQRWRDDGSFCARQGEEREANPHAPGTEAHQQWDNGWRHNQERIAAAMGAGQKPVDSGRTKPTRAKNGGAAAPAKRKAAGGVPRARRRAAAEEPAVH